MKGYLIDFIVTIKHWLYFIYEETECHKDIIDNYLANKYTKKGYKLIKIHKLVISTESIKKQIKEQAWNQWQSQIKLNRLDLKPEESQLKYINSKTYKLIFSTIMQLKLNHDYFKAYLYKLRHAETNLYTCKQKQTSEHLIF